MQTFINTWGDSNMNKTGTQACKHRPGFFEYQRKVRNKFQIQNISALRFKCIKCRQTIKIHSKSAMIPMIGRFIAVVLFPTLIFPVKKIITMPIPFEPDKFIEGISRFLCIFILLTVYITLLDFCFYLHITFQDEHET